MGTEAPKRQYWPSGDPSACCGASAPSAVCANGLRKEQPGVILAAVKEGAGAMGLRDFLTGKQTGAMCKW